MPANARDLFDPSIQTAQFVGERIANLTEKDVVVQGGQKIAQIRYELDDVAQLKALERFVKEDSLSKIFGDGEILGEIADTRVVDVSFFKMKDDSGISIAKIDGGTNAMLALLSKADIDDLDLMPRYREPKKKEQAAPQMATISLADGKTLEVQMAAVKAEEAPRRAPPAMHRVAGQVAVPMHNPVALKEFLARAWTASSMSQPASSANDMILGSLMALSSEAHPEDAAWPEGIKAFNVLDEGKQIEGPARAVAIFAAAVAGREGPVINRDDLIEQLRQRKLPKP